MSTRTPGPEGICHSPTRPGDGENARAGSSAASRTSMACRAGVSAAAAAANTAADSGAPAAIHSCSATRSRSVMQLGHAVLDLEARIDLEEPEPSVRVEQELGGRGVVQVRGTRRLDREVVQFAPARPVSGPAPAIPRRVSGAVAGWSSRAPPARRSCRRRHQAAGPRCGEPAEPRVPGRPRHHRRPPWPPRIPRPGRPATPSGSRRAASHDPRRRPMP